MAARELEAQVSSQVSKVRTRAHTTHTISANDDIAWCGRCGAVTSLEGGYTCEVIEARGRQNLAMIMQGKNPLAQAGRKKP